MVARPVIPTAPPRDEGYSSGSPPTSSAGRGIVRPHSVSPFMRVVRQRREQESQEEEVDLEAVSCLLNFSTRERGQPRPQTPGAQVTVSSFVIEGTPGAAEGVTTSTTSVMVRTFATSPPTTPGSAPRPDRPPPIISGRRQSGHLVRPRPLRRRSLEEQERDLRRMTHSCHSCTGSAPSAALGAPPRQEEEEEDNESLELPDLPETPASPATSDITVIRLVERSFFWKK